MHNSLCLATAYGVGWFSDTKVLLQWSLLSPIHITDTQMEATTVFPFSLFDSKWPYMCSCQWAVKPQQLPTITVGVRFVMSQYVGRSFTSTPIYGNSDWSSYQAYIDTERNEVWYCCMLPCDLHLGYPKSNRTRNFKCST